MRRSRIFIRPFQHYAPIPASPLTIWIFHPYTSSSTPNFQGWLGPPGLYCVLQVQLHRELSWRPSILRLEEPLGSYLIILVSLERLPTFNGPRIHPFTLTPLVLTTPFHFKCPFPFYILFLSSTNSFMNNFPLISFRVFPSYLTNQKCEFLMQTIIQSNMTRANNITEKISIHFVIRLFSSRFSYTS